MTDVIYPNGEGPKKETESQHDKPQICKFEASTSFSTASIWSKSHQLRFLA